VDGNGRWLLIGSGSFGRVFSALNEDTSELIAVKQLQVRVDAAGKATQEGIGDFQKEVSLMQRLSHVNIVTYFGSEAAGSSLLIFMEQVTGGSVADLLEKAGPFPEHLVVHHAHNILRGIKYLHDNRVIHRDIKGKNILLTHDGIAKISDFGSAVQLRSILQRQNSTRGTVAYMAPEMIHHEGRGYSFGTDVWSFGCTLIEMATARAPWSHVSNDWTTAYLIAIAKTKPDIPTTLSNVCTAFISSCFELDATLRPSATELLAHPLLQSGGADRRASPRPPLLVAVGATVGDAAPPAAMNGFGARARATTGAPPPALQMPDTGSGAGRDGSVDVSGGRGAQSRTAMVGLGGEADGAGVVVETAARERTVQPCGSGITAGVRVHDAGKGMILLQV
jgi:serine/threonine protein kinase